MRTSAPSFLSVLALWALAILPHFCSVLVAGEWPMFRGPGGSGVAGEGAMPPVKPGAGNLAWEAAVPPGHSSPVVSGGRVFLTAVEDGRLLTLCFDRRTGEELWRRGAPEVALEKVHETSSPAASTPLADAARLYVYFGSFGLLCYDHDGAEIWGKPIPTPQSLYGMSTSPVSYRDTLILVLDNQADLPGSKLSASKLVAFRKADGEVAWETGRPQERSGWSTPTVWEHSVGVDLVVLGSGRVRAYDPGDGREKWSMGGFSRETIAVPVTGDGHVYVASAQLGGGADKKIDPAPFWAALLRFDADGDGRVGAGEMTEHFTYPLRPELPLGHPGYGIPLPREASKRNERQRRIFERHDENKDGYWTREEWAAHMAVRGGRPILAAIRPGGEGDIGESHVSWELNKSVPEVPSPLFYDGRIYMVRNGGLLAAVDAGEGRQIYRERLGGSGQYSASPVLANGHLYLLSNEGQLTVVPAGDAFGIAHRHDLGRPAFVTPAVDADTIYVRTAESLIAFRAGGAAGR